MKFVISSDPLGYTLKEKVKEHLLDLGHEVVDVGTQSPDNPLLFTDAATNAARIMQKGKVDYGFLFCGSGMGMSIVANKHKGCYCAVVESLFATHLCREINNANMLSMGGNIVGPGMAIAMVDEFINTKFANDATDPARQERLKGFFESVQGIENSNFK